MHQRHQRRRIIQSAQSSISQNEWFESCLNQAIKIVQEQQPLFFRSCDFAFADIPPIDDDNREISFSSSYINQELGTQRIVFYKFPILSKISYGTDLPQFLAELIRAHKQ
jgi:hypothetical protein